MSDTVTTPDTKGIEHLDFDPQCDAAIRKGSLIRCPREASWRRLCKCGQNSLICNPHKVLADKHGALCRCGIVKGAELRWRPL